MRGEDYLRRSVPYLDTISQFQHTEREVILRNRGPLCEKQLRKAPTKFRLWTGHLPCWICWERASTPLGLAQVATSLQLHKSTAHRFLMVLEKHRMVERTAGGKFRLGLRLFDLGNRAIEQYDLRERAQPHLRRLVAETEETAHLCILEGAHVIYIDKIEPARSVRMITRIGASNPVHCTSVGKAMLAFLPEERIARYSGPYPL